MLIWEPTNGSQVDDGLLSFCRFPCNGGTILYLLIIGNQPYHISLCIKTPNIGV